MEKMKIKILTKISRIIATIGIISIITGIFIIEENVGYSFIYSGILIIFSVAVYKYYEDCIKEYK